jgi:hypothetical protein
MENGEQSIMFNRFRSIQLVYVAFQAGRALSPCRDTIAIQANVSRSSRVQVASVVVDPGRDLVATCRQTKHRSAGYAHIHA